MVEEQERKVEDLVAVWQLHQRSFVSGLCDCCVWVLQPIVGRRIELSGCIVEAVSEAPLLRDLETLYCGKEEGRRR